MCFCEGSGVLACFLQGKAAEIREVGERIGWIEPWEDWRRRMHVPSPTIRTNQDQPRLAVISYAASSFLRRGADRRRHQRVDSMFPSEWDAVSLALIYRALQNPALNVLSARQRYWVPSSTCYLKHSGVHIAAQTSEWKSLRVISSPHELRPRTSNLTLGHREGPFEEELRRVATVRALDARAPSERIPPEPRNQYCVAMNS